MEVQSTKKRSAIEEQQHRITRFMTIVFVVLSLYIMGTICNTALFQSENIVEAVIAIVVFILGAILNVFLYKKTDGRLIPYTGMGLYLVLVCYLLFWGLNISTYIYLFPALFLSIMYFDSRYSILVAVLVSVINGIDVVLLLQADTTTKFDLNTPYAVQIFGIVLCSILTCSITNISKKNNSNVINEVIEEKQKQEETAKQILAIAEEVKEKIETSDTIIMEINNSNDVVNRAVKEISQSTKSNADSIMQQTQMTQNIQVVIDNTNETAGSMSKLAEESMVAIHEGLEVIERIKDKSDNLVQANQKVSAVMENLEAKMQEVQQITGMIYGISSQTNLLALNASIEAARAGEHGRSFSVVAEQIRQLADETRRSTESINLLLEELTVNTVGAKEASGHVQGITTEETELIAHAETKFTNINQVNNQLTKLIEATSQKIAEITEANNNIVDSVTQLSATSQQVTASSDEAYDLCCHNSECVEKETNLLHEIDILVQKFKL
ncbi:methyl-accepting chemotaxis protein [Anaerosporobacter faecicola]|uniref:methyl-accepting chemotaxis protein n=1 Tax=Anaerosporobacter faecicola TaxID=2718714 RepID=UPI00143BA62E|nr:methyl-accepting chemotaxis protein [Anaerosporobacter faecicola]